MAAAMMVEELRPVIGGVDTHKDFHVAAVVDSLGGDPRVGSFSNNAAGHEAWLVWLSSHGPLQVVGVEGTGSYGAGLTGDLRAAGVLVLEVNRPDRQARRRRHTPDPAAVHIPAVKAGLPGTVYECPTCQTRYLGPNDARTAPRSANVSALAAFAPTATSQSPTKTSNQHDHETRNLTLNTVGVA